MEDELDVDIEGEELDSDLNELQGAGLVQDHFLQSAWRSSAGVLPWELDSSISPENREVIEKMLLEEQYYLTGEKVQNHIWEGDINNKAKVKKSPAKTSTSGSSSRWSKQERELFEEGLAQFGRRWTKISKLLGSRSVLQVKSYARQYFKHKTKSDSRATAPPAGPVEHLQPPQLASSQPLALSKTVRIEKLSDEEDEEVDITDDLSDEGDGESCEPELQTETETLTDPLTQDQSEPGLTENQHSESFSSPESPGAKTDSEDEDCQPEGPAQTGQQEDTCRDRSDPAERTEPNQTDAPEEDQQDEEEEEEEEELKAPEQEVEMDLETISEDEKQAIPEFFEGRPSKTPERYLKIRNYILDQWMKSRPRYLNKTSVRPGLKNCGDVNCIGRIHTYLELIGAINFGCEQAVYNRPRVVDRSRQKEGRDVMEAYQLAQRLQSMRTRKRRVRDTWGNWCDPKDLEGQTYEHLSAEELARRREEMKNRPKPCKSSRFRESVDPFQLILCRSFGEDVQEPFQVIVCAETLLIMDMHAHVSRGEVIGLLGGTFNEEKKVLKISAAEPCNSVSTGLQCEMDPLSQTQACDMLSSLGFSVVGWYHSHPSFHPNPSVRDINTQDQFQSYFSRGGAPFIGMIVSPYDPANRSPHSQTTCLLVRESLEPTGLQKLPYRFDFLSSSDCPNWDQTLRRAQWIIDKYSQSRGSVQMDRFFRKDSHLTCLEKVRLACLQLVLFVHISLTSFVFLSLDAVVSGTVPGAPAG
ncbi:histone H2A deubiquitinase MYSM1 [Xyrichtys novacula]|uniref:Myb-like, SWIRM and MPN domain-containing protein 1 n=1 Tax=Xyrichtys novacula TaxID=13765 RepID=A0AAV1FIB4_XYRNO|nr:histone H2A deubiquitinase MYSM1 [Xyrichtys novacula]